MSLLKIFQKKEKFINKNEKSIRVCLIMLPFKTKTFNLGMKCNKIVISRVPLTELIFML